MERFSLTGHGFEQTVRLRRGWDRISTRAVLGGMAERAASGRAHRPPVLPCATLTHHTQAVAQSRRTPAREERRR